MDFGTLPPEISSGQIYLGPGSASMIGAAAMWDTLAIRLCTAAADYRSVTSKLAQGWQGPAASAMIQAAATYIEWLNATAAQAEQTATQAKAAANAFESALASVVPPPVIAANRALRRSLATTNCLGESSQPIADIEADYERMWAQNAQAMYTYTAASAAVSTVTPFTSPPPARQGTRGRGGWKVTAAPEIASAGYQVISTLPHVLQGLLSSPLTTFDVSLSPVSSSLSKLSSLGAPLDCAVKRLNHLNKAAALRTLLPKPGGASGVAATAAVGRGTSIGPLSAPPAWAAGTTGSPGTVEALPGAWSREPIRLVYKGVT